MNIRDLDLNLLFVFEAIYSTGNISQAAKRLDLSQSATSNALTRLRKHLDDQLFVRDGNGVAPTVRAENIIVPIRTALTTIKSGLGDYDAFDPATSKRHFHLLIADPIEPLLMPALLKHSDEEPNITYELSPPQSVPLEDALKNNKLDLAVFLAPSRIPELRVEPLIALDLVGLARQGHPRLCSGNLPLEAFSSERLVALNLDYGKLANSEKVTLWQRTQHKIACKVFKVSSIPNIVANTGLIGIVPRLYAEHVAKHLDLQILTMPTPMSNQRFQLIWHERNDVDDAHCWLRKRIKSVFSDLE